MYDLYAGHLFNSNSIIIHLLSTSLQPENLLLDSYGVLKVSDFGLSAFSKQIRVRDSQLLPKSLRKYVFIVNVHELT